jgi:ribonuclease BN (tRNA processing enzyme)
MKNHHHNGSHSTTKSVLHEAIAARAYELWVSHGKPENRSDEIWLEAEREQVSGRKTVPTELGLPVSF